MANKFKILIISLLLNSTTFSQKDTNKICFDYKIGQKIAVDLVKGDAAQAELKKTQVLVDQLNDKISEKDSIIWIYIKKDTNYLKQIKLYADIQQTNALTISELKKDVNTLETKNNNLKAGIKWVAGGFVGTLISLITLIAIK
jgi:ABC-type phosphate transport system auxiliary subunit